MCKDKEDRLVVNEQQVLNVWTEYFKDLLNKKDADEPQDMINYYGPDISISTPTTQIVNEVIKKLKNNRAPGEDLISAELIKHGGKELWKYVYDLICDIWESEVMPKDWNIALLRPIHKKGNTLLCSNYRGISLLNITYKIFTSILAKYIEPYAEQSFGEYQCGFRRGRSTTDQIFALRMILEKFYEYDKPLYQLYVDFQQAFDSVDRNYIYEAMAEFGIPSKLIRLTKMTLTNTLNKVKIQNKLSDTFTTHSGIRQGDSLSALLFNIGLEKAIRRIIINPGGTIFNRTRTF